jgi:hypothetical protein
MAKTTPILEQIAQMLAKAESTTPAEAEMITKRAEKLMIRHGIDEAMLQASKTGKAAKTEDIVEKRTTFVSGSYGAAYIMLAQSVVTGLGSLRLIQSHYRANYTAHIIGHESDVDAAIMLIDSLRVQADSAMASWWATTGKYELEWGGRQEQWKARRQFILSFGYAVQRRLIEARRTTIKEMEAETGATGTELVLVSRKELVDAKVTQMYPKLSRGRGIDGSAAGRAAGAAAGARANLGKSIGS